MGGDGHLFEGHQKETELGGGKNPKVATEWEAEQKNQHRPRKEMEKGEEMAACLWDTQKNPQN